MKITAFNYEVSTEGLSLNNIGTLFDKIVLRKNYDWWYEIMPDDIVVDIGAGVGLFSCKSLDAGAEKVYMIEPSKKVLKTAIRNVSEYMMDTQNPRVVPINYAIGKMEDDLSGVFKPSRDITRADIWEEYKLMSFLEFLGKYKIDHIDYLRIDAEGSEYNILTEDSYDFIRNNVRHVAVECHLTARTNSAKRFIHFRDNFLKKFVAEEKVRFQYPSYMNLIFDDEEILVGKVLPREFMIYITNY
jgi:FkbM family methyltransferase